MFAQADATHIPLADKSVDLVFTSPPYLAARLYLEGGKNHGIARGCEAWVKWMLQVVTECCRVSRGLVLVNCAGQTKNWRYQPGPEILLADWWRQGGECWRPAYWHRVGIPGSGGKQWLRADVEYILAFKAEPGKIPWADNTACGHIPKWGPGGEMSHRVSSGARVNQWGHSYETGGVGGSIDDATCRGPRPSHRKLEKRGSRRPNGEIKDIGYTIPVLANPGNLVKVNVGGGIMGSKFAHENEAPFPERLAEFFIKLFCPPGGTVLDPFSGSGTTVSVARRLGRIGIGFDLRMSQCDLGRRRLAEPVVVKKSKARPAKREELLFPVEAA